jgi:hypothetical protein
MDSVTRDALEARTRRHQRSRWWALLRLSRCRSCGFRWPCVAYRDARRTLDTSAAMATWANTVTQPQPRVGPLLTPGQEYRSERRPR